MNPRWRPKRQRSLIPGVQPGNSYALDTSPALSDGALTSVRYWIPGAFSDFSLLFPNKDTPQLPVYNVRRKNVFIKSQFSPDTSRTAPIALFKDAVPESIGVLNAAPHVEI